MTWVLICLGGAVGAPARFLVDRAVSRRSPGQVPWGTITVNVLGCALLGVLARPAAGGSAHGLVLAAAGVGFCGGFTTFSTFTWETLALVEDGVALAALVNLGASLALGLAAAWAGYVLT